MVEEVAPDFNQPAAKYLAGHKSPAETSTVAASPFAVAIGAARTLNRAPGFGPGHREPQSYARRRGRSAWAGTAPGRAADRCERVGSFQPAAISDIVAHRWCTGPWRVRA